jgi:hypothetical protein
VRQEDDGVDGVRQHIAHAYAGHHANYMKTRKMRCDPLAASYNCYNGLIMIIKSYNRLEGDEVDVVRKQRVQQVARLQRAPQRLRGEIITIIIIIMIITIITVV